MVIRGAPCRGPALLAGNHAGYLDVVALSAMSPALFVSKDDLAGWPVLGFLGRSVGTLFLKRGSPRAVTNVGNAMQAAFREGRRVIVFPEGTTSNGHCVLPFHPSLFEPALRAGVPVQASAIAWTRKHPRDPEDLAVWIGDAEFLPHLWQLFCARGLTARIVFREAVSGYPDRRTAAESTRAWIVGVSDDGPVVGANDHLPLQPPPHGVGHATPLVRGLAHRIRGMRHGHRAPGTAQQRQVVGGVPRGKGVRDG